MRTSEGTCLPTLPQRTEAPLQSSRQGTTPNRVAFRRLRFASGGRFHAGDIGGQLVSVVECRSLRPMAAGEGLENMDTILFKVRVAAQICEAPGASLHAGPGDASEEPAQPWRGIIFFRARKQQRALGRLRKREQREALSLR